MLQCIPTFTLVPRFILNLRKLYACDVRGRCGSEIDTAFGLDSAFGHGAAATTLMFADAGQHEGLEQGEEIRGEGEVYSGSDV